MYKNICNFIDKEMRDLDSRIVSNGKLSMNEIQYVDLLSHAKKSMLTVDAMENYDGEYGKRDRMGRYADEEHRVNQEMIDSLHHLMNKASNDEVKRKYESFISEMEHMM